MDPDWSISKRAQQGSSLLMNRSVRSHKNIRIDSVNIGKPISLPVRPVHPVEPIYLFTPNSSF